MTSKLGYMPTFFLADLSTCFNNLFYSPLRLWVVFGVVLIFIIKTSHSYLPCKVSCHRFLTLQFVILVIVIELLTCCRIPRLHAIKLTITFIHWVLCSGSMLAKGIAFVEEVSKWSNFTMLLLGGCALILLFLVVISFCFHTWLIRFMVWIDLWCD